MTFDPAIVHGRLRAAGLGGEVHHAEVTASTQDLAREAAASGAPAWTTFVADEQTRGRGRQGRPWVAPRGSALLASVVLRPRIPAAHLPPLSLVVGLALHDAIQPRLRAARVTLKWPNDLLVGDGKLAGILVEASLRGDRPDAVVAGFGVNLLTASLPPEIAHRATCLEQHGALDLDRHSLLADILVALDLRISSLEQRGLGSLIEQLRAIDGARGRRVRWGDQEGVAVGLTDDGRIQIETPHGLVAPWSGEVLFLTRLPAD